jgi:hypothetical protein
MTHRTATDDRPGLEAGEGGHPVGRDPRRMSPAELRTLGHERKSPMQAIREHCLDCCGGSPQEVRLCPAVRCAKWPFRMGVNPWRAPPSEARRAASREAGRRLAENTHRKRANPIGAIEPDAATPLPATTLPAGE